MSSSSPVLLPCCLQCSAVQTDGNWLMTDGVMAKTATKLSACSRCHVARYCNGDCQRKHWSTHKVGCFASEKVITPLEVDRIVQMACKPQSGKVCLYISAKKELLQSDLFPEVKAGELCVELSIDTKLIGCYNYRICSPSQCFDWKGKLSAILHPADGIHNPGAQVELGHEMIEKGLYTEAFQMMAESTPPGYGFLKDMFFPNAIKLMSSQGISIEIMVSCAQLLKKNRVEVEVLIRPPATKRLPEDLQARIKAAEQLYYGQRDLKMVELAKEVMELDLYDQAFDLVFNWVAIEAPKKVFFTSAAKIMIEKKVDHEKIVQLAKTIGLSVNYVLGELVGIYPYHGQTQFACQLAQGSHNPDYYLEIVFSALVLQKKNDEARAVLNLVSPAKKRDLQFSLKK